MDFIDLCPARVYDQSYKQDYELVGAMGQFNLFGGKIAFGRSKTALKVETKVTERLTGIAADEEAKIRMQHLVDYLKHPSDLEAGKTEILRGVIVTGPPGTDKFLIAKAIAGEAGVMLFSISGP